MDLKTMLAALRAGEGKPFSLLRDKEKIEQVKTHPYYVPMLQEMQRRAEESMAQPLLSMRYSHYQAFDATGSRDDWQHVWHERKGYMAALAAMCVYREDEKYIHELEDLIWSVCDVYNWCLPAHITNGGTTVIETMNRFPADGNMYAYAKEHRHVVDLGAAEMAGQLTEILYELEDKLAPMVVYRARHEIQERVLQPFMAIGAPYNWETTDNNWAAVCACGVGMAAMYLMKDSAMLAPVLVRCCQAMDCFLDAIEDDGVCAEGLSYWNYGFGNYLIFADLLKARTGGAIDLMQGEKIRQIALFQQRAMLTGENCVSFSDCYPTLKYQFATTHKLQQLFPNDLVVPDACYGSLQTDPFGKINFLLRNFTWTDPETPTGPLPDGETLLPGTQWLIVRRSFGDFHTAVAAKAGHNAEPHNHNDIGSFEIDAGGDMLLCDIGSAQYTKDYFRDETRYGYLVNGSQGHSVPEVGGCRQQMGRGFAAKDVELETTEEAAWLQADIAGAYENAGLQSLVRRVEVSKTEPRVTVTDAIAFAGEPQPVVERMVTRFVPVVAEGCVTIAGENGTAKIFYDAEQLACTLREDSFMLKLEHVPAPVYILDFALRKPENKQQVKFEIQLAKK
ncbi:MAG: heparinase II/III family protein [Clostridia bacterium]|nr:heparinase II/III family protein [Clostridia bacterium]